jgi:hypothetical protein
LLSLLEESLFDVVDEPELLSEFFDEQAGIVAARASADIKIKLRFKFFI